MITAYTRENGRIAGNPLPKGGKPSENIIWVDLMSPDDEERKFASQAFGVDLPTRQEMSEIEASSRLYSEDGSVFLTVDVLSGSDTPDPVLGALLIVATPKVLITTRYCEPRSVATFSDRIKQQPALFATVEDGLLALLDAISDRIADILETLSKDEDALSREIFRRGSPGRKEKRLQDILQGIGRAGDATHKLRDSISGMTRLLTFLGPLLTPHLNAEQLAKFQALDRDIASLAEHAVFASQETAFLLDATLGQINIEQNNIIKLLSIVMVAFTPPTFFASMWGMNFHNMPEYSWEAGYAMAIGVMLVSAILPIWYFKKRGWL